MFKRIFLKLVGIIVALIVLATVAAVVMWPRVPNIIASKLSEKMGVRVAIGNIHLDWEDIDIGDVEVGNPQGSLLVKAFSAKEISLRTPLRRYLDDPIVIDRLEISDVYVGVEFTSKKSKKGNWSTILGNLEKNQTPNSEKGKTVLIKKLVLTNINIDLAFNKEQQVNHLDTIQRLEFDNVSSEKGIPYEQLSSIILKQMLKKIFSIENLTDMLQDLLPSPSKLPGSGTLQKLKGLFGG